MLPPPEHKDPLAPPGETEHSNTPEHVNASALLMDDPAVPSRPWKPAPLALGVDPKAPRTANKVYSSIVSGMLTEVQHQFGCLLFVDNAYPNIDTQVNWSIKLWEKACIGSGNYYDLGKDMMNLVRGLSITHPDILTPRGTTDQGEMFAWQRCYLATCPPSHQCLI
jgi:hypothetical protein